MFDALPISRLDDLIPFALVLARVAGLFAAIPAVIFYNRYVNEISRYGTRLDAFSDEFSAILSRQLDEKAR